MFTSEYSKKFLLDCIGLQISEIKRMHLEHTPLRIFYGFLPSSIRFFLRIFYGFLPGSLRIFYGFFTDSAGLRIFLRFFYGFLPGSLRFFCGFLRISAGQLTDFLRVLLRISAGQLTNSLRFYFPYDSMFVFSQRNCQNSM